MATLTRSITIDAPVATVFDVALDISRLWRAKDVALTEIDVRPGGVGTSARLYSHLLGFHLEGGVEYVEVVPGRRIVAQAHWFAEKPTWTFEFEPVDDGTRMTATGEWELKVPVVGKPVERMLVREHEPFIEEMLAGFKARVEGRSAA